MPIFQIWITSSKLTYILFLFLNKRAVKCVFVTIAAQPQSNWATSWHHMAQFSVHTLWIPAAPEEFCASVPVQLWGVRGGGVVWQLSLLANSTKFQYSGQPHVWNIYQGLDKKMKNKWKSFFMVFQIFKDCFIKFTWEFHFMCAQSIMVLLNSTVCVWPVRRPTQKTLTMLRIPADQNYQLAMD